MASAPAPASEEKPKKADTLVVRLLADYWDADGVRHSAAYVENGELHPTGALVELPGEEARKLVKTSAAERGDEY
jgi:hypothetical protein